MADFDKYIKALRSFNINDITEHTHRGALKELLESIAGKNIKILHEPKREGKFGAPDFKIIATENIIGYIENKKIDESLDKIIKSEQIKKYQSLSDNILITNYIEWIWLKNGITQNRATLCTLTNIENKLSKINEVNANEVAQLLQSFFSQPPKEIGDSKKLAEALATRAKLLKDFLLEILQQQVVEKQEGRVYQLYETFKNFVFSELSVEEFADAFAQNLVYGLFLARLNADANTINLYNAKKYIPISFELIRELVNFLDELDNIEYSQTKWIVEEVLTILNNLNISTIQESLSFTNKKNLDKNSVPIKDPYIYFYEDFLAAYDKNLRKAKGVYYTPPQIVNFIVRAIDDILINTFNIDKGLADPEKVTVLDFATGTGTFLLEIMEQIFNKLPKNSGKKNLLIHEHILKNIFGFEYLIAPYTIAHLKLSQYLKDNGYEMQGKERLQVYLTNTLEPIPSQIKIPLLPALTNESKAAQLVKDKPILVITGNPPYSKKSKNNGAWIVKLINDYKYVDGQHFKEKQNWFRDDYVKFIRFAQEKMDKVEEGIVGIITNHSFLDNTTFRGMRQSLLNSFDQLYILNLHGSAKKEENIPKGVLKDENVFDIEQGVSISLLIKSKKLPKKVFYADFWGTRKDKYQRAITENLNSIPWKELQPCSPNYYLILRDEKYESEYNQFYSIKDIFKISGLPLMTGNDAVTIHNDASSLEKTLKFFASNTIDTIKQHLHIKEDTSNWTVAKAKNDIINTKANPKYYRTILYRPFINKISYFTENNAGFLSRPAMKVNNNMKYPNIGLLIPRQLSKNEYKHIFCTNLIPEMCAISTATKEANQLFPLYLYINAPLENENNELMKVENFTEAFRKYIDGKYGHGTSPESILGYIYAILHSQTYRNKYIEFLKTDFPKILFTEDTNIFNQVSVLGFELIEVHLMKKKQINETIGAYTGIGNNIVEKCELIIDAKTSKLYINATQYFDNVSLEIYNFQIGGYKVLEKYLKEYKGRAFTTSIAVDYVQQIIGALIFTINQMEKIELLTKNWI